MRSDKIHKVLSQGMRATHKLGSRFEDTINDTLDYLGVNKSNQKSIHSTSNTPGDKSLKSAA